MRCSLEFFVVFLKDRVESPKSRYRGAFKEGNQNGEMRVPAGCKLSHIGHVSTCCSVCNDEYDVLSLSGKLKDYLRFTVTAKCICKKAWWLTLGDNSFHGVARLVMLLELLRRRFVGRDILVPKVQKTLPPLCRSIGPPANQRLRFSPGQ